MENMNSKMEYVKADARVICFIKEDIVAESCIATNYEECSGTYSQGCDSTASTQCNRCMDSSKK